MEWGGWHPVRILQDATVVAPDAASPCGPLELLLPHTAYLPHARPPLIRASTPSSTGRIRPHHLPAAMAVERPVRLVLDASLLLDPAGGGCAREAEPALRPGAEALLRRLRYSNLGVELCCSEEIPTNVSDFLEKTTNLYSFGYTLLPSPTRNHLPDESMLELSRSSSCFYATSRVDEDLFSELQNHNWTIIAVGCGYFV